MHMVADALRISAGQDVLAESKKHKVGRLYMAMLVAKRLQEKEKLG